MKEVMLKYYVLIWVIVIFAMVLTTLKTFFVWELDCPGQPIQIIYPTAIK